MRKPPTLILEVVALTAAVAVAAAVSLVSKSTAKPVVLYAPTVLGSQPDGAVVVAQEDRDLAVALALKPQSGKLLALVTALDQEGTGAAGLDVRVSVATRGGATVSATAQPGPLGTYQALLPASGRPESATVDVAGPGAAAKPLRFALTGAWPPRPATALLAKVDRAYTRLASLVTHERLASSPTNAIVSVYHAVAPSTLEIVSSNGLRAIVIGNRRWDKSGGGPWRESPQQPPIASIAPFWSGVIEDPTVLRRTTYEGRPATVLSFAAPQIPAFFEITVDDATDRTVDLRMTASAHFMHHRYGPFNTTLAIRPPG